MTKLAFIGLPSFIGFGTLHASTISLEDFLASAIDISHAGPEAQLIALQKLQSTVYRFIEQTREQIAEAGAEAGANAKNGASEIEKSSDF